MIDAAALAGAAVVLAGSLLVTIPVPWGGQVPLGLTLAMALPALLPAGRLAAVEVAGLVLALGLRHRTSVRPDVLCLGARSALAMAAGGAVAAGVQVASDGPHVLAVAAAAAGAVLVAEVAWALAGGTDAPRRLRSALPVYLTLGCAGTLFAVAVDEVGVAMAAVTAFPLLLTRVAFRRYAEATSTLEQTVRALGLVPELAGLTPVGHSERSAHYAAVIAAELGFDRPEIDRIVTATRLHRLGAVRHDETDAPTTPSEVAASGARILRESGFPGAVADLLQSAPADGYGVASPTLAAAVVRVATAFDHAVADDPTATDRGLALVSVVSLDRFDRQAAGALLTLVATQPDLITGAVAAGDRFRQAAEGFDLERLADEHPNGALLPFTHRRA
ncbi:MAG: hypothetical protein JWN29_2771 [Acidimicrobiales bacterium]|nr:hypothetical protein [Acidimicrobiales bacterium]